MFERLKEIRNDVNESGKRYSAFTKAMEQRDVDQLRVSLNALGRDFFNDFDRFKLICDVIKIKDLDVFKVTLDFLGGDPNLEMKQLVKYGRGTYQVPTLIDETPLSYALKNFAHDISMHLANDPRTRINEDHVRLAKTGGMSDVADVLASRVPEFPKAPALAPKA